MSDVDFHDPARPTRYVTPEEFGVGTNYVAGCPKCGGNGLARWFYWPWLARCRFCKGFGSVLYERQADGAFKAKRRSSSRSVGST